MDWCCARRSRWLPTLVATGLVGLTVASCLREAHPQSAKRRDETRSATSQVRDLRSRHFLIHTDLPADEANGLVERLETMLQSVSSYWGRPMQGVIECYVVRKLDTFPLGAMDPDGVQAMRTSEGVTLMRTVSDGRRYLAKSVVYAMARPEVVQHEAVHAYCHHTFGCIGPVWYSEGMAEMGHYWKEGDPAVHAEPRETKFLRDNPPKSLAETLSPMQVTGDSWQNYASRWALCHFLIHHPSYSSQFSALGRDILSGKDVTFEQAFAATLRQLSFEYYLFLKHIDRGYRVDLCTWDWNKSFASPRPGRMLSAAVVAGRGWQPSGLSVKSGTPYQYAAIGNWRVAGKSEAVDADGNDAGCGRLVGVLMKDYQLSAEFELGAEGVLQLPANGNLYLRCRNAWNELANDSGRISVKFKAQGRGPTVHKAD